MAKTHEAPRREIVDVVRVGPYGASFWHHYLECMHIEKRKRRSFNTTMGCTSCLAGEREVPEDYTKLSYALCRKLGIEGDPNLVSPIGARVWLALDEIKRLTGSGA